MDNNKKSLQNVLAVARESIQPLPNFDKAKGVQAGDCFLFRGMPDAPVFWVAILPNKDDHSVWYTVPADTLTYVGTCDVKVESDDVQQAGLVLRCGHGLWIRDSDFPSDLYIGHVDADSVEYAKEKFQLMVVGELVGSADAEITDLDPDYLEWTDKIEQAVSQLENQIQNEPVVLKISQAVDHWKQQVNYDFEVDNAALAASGSLGFQAVQGDSQAPTLVFNDVLPGSVVIAIEKDAIYVTYYSAGDETPDKIVLINGRTFDGSWGEKPEKGPFLLTPKIPKDCKSIELVFASGKSIQVQMDQE